jgi:hypothetical protein
MRLLQTLGASLAYAAIVFGIGFVLGTARVLLIVPRIGVRWAELLEAPLMLVASYLAARFVTRRQGPFTKAQSALIGVLALLCMLLAEIAFVLAQGLGLSAYVAGRDPVSGTAYLLSLAAFAAMPLLARRHSGGD